MESTHMIYNRLIDEAKQIQKTNIQIHKDYLEYAFTFSYPPPQSLYQIDENSFKCVELDDTINVYIHIPYCTGKCSYCYFCCYKIDECHVKKSEYVSLLCHEIELARKKYGIKKIKSIHIGGGTPTTLTEFELEKIFKCLHHNFIIEPNIEITCESSPETVTLKKLIKLIDLGVNRLNIGIQCFNDDILKKLNRRHDSNMAIEAIKKAKTAGFKNINIDLMYGLPTQTIEDWEKTLNIAKELQVQSISAYRLRWHPKSKLEKTITAKFDDDMIEFYFMLVRKMNDFGFIQASSHKFSREENAIQKQIISKRGIKKNELLSFGLSAYGFIGNILYWNARTIEVYKQNINKDVLPYSLGFVLDEKEQKSKSCVLGIHNYKGINIKDYNNHFNSDFKVDFKNQIEFCQLNNLAKVENDHFSLTNLGMVFSDEIAIMFYSDNIKNILTEKQKRYGMFFDEII